MCERICWKQFYSSFDKSVQQEMLLYSWKQFYASLDESVLQGMLLSDLTVGRNSILNIPAKTRTRMCRALLCGGDW